MIQQHRDKTLTTFPFSSSVSSQGKATALKFAREGAEGIILVARTLAKLEQVAKEVEAAGSKAIVIAGDVSAEETSKEMIDAAVETFGHVDVAFLNAGGMGQKPIVELTGDDIDGAFNSNFKSVVWGLKHALPAMAKSPNKGSVVVNTSIMASIARANFAGSSMYAASKAAANMLVKYAAIEAAADGTRVNAIEPGVVATNLTGLDEASIHGFAQGIQLIARAGSSDEIASVVAMLASDAGSFMTGTIVQVDGGWSVKA